MPTLLQILGWRVFFYSEEGTEPVRVHAKKGGAECKLWLRAEVYDIEEAWSYGLTPALRRAIPKIILAHFDLILEEWERHIGGQRDAGH